MQFPRNLRVLRALGCQRMFARDVGPLPAHLAAVRLEACALSVELSSALLARGDRIRELLVLRCPGVADLRAAPRPPNLTETPIHELTTRPAAVMHVDELEGVEDPEALMRGVSVLCLRGCAALERLPPSVARMDGVAVLLLEP